MCHTVLLSSMTTILSLTLLLSGQCDQLRMAPVNEASVEKKKEIIVLGAGERSIMSLYSFTSSGFESDRDSFRRSGADHCIENSTAGKL